MKIGIDLQVLKNARTGIGNYAFNLAQSLKKINTGHEFVFFDGPKGNIPFWSRHVSYGRAIARRGIEDIGYNDASYGFDSKA